MNDRSQGILPPFAAVLLGCALILVGGCLIPGRSVGQAFAEAPLPHRTSLDIGLTGSASASSEASGSPASAAIDGNASTDWCSTQWTGSVTVDLGRVRSLDGLGVTLGNATTSALVDISSGTTAGSMQPVAQARISRCRPASRSTGPPRRDAACPLREGRGDRQRRDAAMHRRAAAVRPRRCPRRPRSRRRPLLRTPGGGRGSAIHRRGQARPRPCRSSTTTVSTTCACGCGSTRRRATATWPATWRWPAGSRPRGTGCISTSTTRTSGPIPRTRTSRPPGRARTSLSSRPPFSRYTQEVIRRFAAQGTPVDMVSIGNEIRNGMLWPVGQVDWTANTGWEQPHHAAQAGVAGARAANPAGHQLLVMLHFDQGGDNARAARSLTTWSRAACRST